MTYHVVTRPFVVTSSIVMRAFPKLVLHEVAQGHDFLELRLKVTCGGLIHRLVEVPQSVWRHRRFSVAVPRLLVRPCLHWSYQ